MHFRASKSHESRNLSQNVSILFSAISEAAKNVVSPAWVSDCVLSNQRLNPFEKILHLPEPKPPKNFEKTKSKFSKFVMSVTNFRSDERKALVYLIRDVAGFCSFEETFGDIFFSFF